MALSLYKNCVKAISSHFQAVRQNASDQPPVTFDMWFDVCRELSEVDTQASLDALFKELTNLDILIQFLKLGHKRIQLHQMYEKVNRAFEDNRLNSQVVNAFHAFRQKVMILQRPNTTQDKYMLCCAGQHLASFLIDGGWYLEAAEILEAAIVNHEIQVLHPGVNLNMMAKLLQSRSEFRQFDKAEVILQGLELNSTDYDQVNADSIAYVYCEVSNYYFWRSMYKESFTWSLKAVEGIRAKTPPAPRVIVDILRQAGKSSVVTRRYPLAQLLLREALLKSHEIYGKDHLKYADCLQDYAFYLLNVDKVGLSVQAYEEALKIRTDILGHNNLLVAKLYEELAYATYVFEYSKGNFDKAEERAELAIQTMKRIIPANHLMVASSQRVLALVLEEIAIDMQDNKAKSSQMLARAEELHLSAVKLTTQAFGEKNVQSAKHYGNLGRLYQTMMRFEEAEKMHLKAIQIKEALLGPKDYEVALSIGHLASLYNYDLNEFNKAEELYLRSIDISLRLFGPSYSGLEYDYRGLIRVYERTGQVQNFAKYILLLRTWTDLKEAKDEENHPDNLHLSSTFLAKRGAASRPHQQILQMIGQLSAENKGGLTKDDKMDHTLIQYAENTAILEEDKEM